MDSYQDQSISIPLFYGQPDQDTISLEEFLSKIDHSVSACSFSQKMAYITFANSLRGSAACWLSYFTGVNRNYPLEWNSIRPLFFGAFKNYLNGFATATTPTPFPTSKACVNSNTAPSTTPSGSTATNNQHYSNALTPNAILDQYIAVTENTKGIVFTRAQRFYIKGIIADELQGLRNDLLEKDVKFDNSTTTHNRPHKGGKTKQFTKLFCIYCRKHNHVEEKCRHRIRDQAPCYQTNNSSVFH